jgi:hypothetical protein
MKALLFAALPAVLLRGCPFTADSSFDLDVKPAIVQPIIPGQPLMLLVQVVNETDGTGKGEVVSLTAAAPDATITVEPSSITPGQVAEVTVTAGQAAVGQDLAVTIMGQRGDAQATATKTLSVTEGNIEDFDELEATAEEMRDLFIPWLEANHPELGITSQTAWTPQLATPYILVVSHYLFLSQDWELHVYWHVMIPPYDWAKIDLRHRFTEAAYSQSFEISSRSDPQQAPHPIDPPEDLWR